MDQLALSSWLWILATFTIAGFVKGVVGMGLPTVAMGLLGAVMPPATAASLLIVPSLVTNIWQLATGPRFIALARRLGSLMVGIAFGTFLGIGGLVGETAGATSALGLALAAYALIGLTPLRLSVPVNREGLLSPVVGLITGLITGSTGVFVIPAVPYLQALNLAKDELVQALGISFTASTVALAIALGCGGQLETSVGIASLFGLVPAIAGMMLGQGVRGMLDEMHFRRWFFIGLLVLGLHLILAG